MSQISRIAFGDVLRSAKVIFVAKVETVAPETERHGDLRVLTYQLSGIRLLLQTESVQEFHAAVFRQPSPNLHDEQGKIVGGRSFSTPASGGEQRVRAGESCVFLAKTHQVRDGILDVARIESLERVPEIEAVLNTTRRA